MLNFSVDYQAASTNPNKVQKPSPIGCGGGTGCGNSSCRGGIACCYLCCTSDNDNGGN
ncbi:hypothetical protein [Ornithinibacillus sp. FSL M8-0202]|uniref:Bacteriocin n=1 Tax=Ornithinibacillus massiliensis TaxID=1944633 RepID=A0ABS5MBY0_9BACI|nr:hypothetical protein [Ornithinibacillus massiliensis]